MSVISNLSPDVLILCWTKFRSSDTTIFPSPEGVVVLFVLIGSSSPPPEPVRSIIPKIPPPEEVGALSAPQIGSINILLLCITSLVN